MHYYYNSVWQKFSRNLGERLDQTFLFLSFSWEFKNRKLFAVHAIEWNLLLEGLEDVSNSPAPKKLTGSVMKSSFYPLPRRIQNQSWWHTKDERKGIRVDFSTDLQRQILKKHMFTVQKRTSVWKMITEPFSFFELSHNYSEYRIVSIKDSSIFHITKCTIFSVSKTVPGSLLLEAFCSRP